MWIGMMSSNFDAKNKDTWPMIAISSVFITLEDF
jgi:hypothetical protein